MINEDKLKEFLRELMIWADLGGRPDVHRGLLKKLNDAFGEKEE